jgi:hypothetical protein
MLHTWPRVWREVKRRPIPGNSPNDRILRGPDCNRPRRVCADSFPATPWPKFPRTQKIPGMRFLRQAESIWSDGFPNQNHQNLGRGAASRWSAPGPQSKDATRGTTRPAHRPQMSSDRLFLDRVARQHCPSPLHRHAQTTTHPLPDQAKQDISTLQGIGHFYFALTRCSDSVDFPMVVRR